MAGGCLISILAVAHEVGQHIKLYTLGEGVASFILLWASFPFSAFFKNMIKERKTGNGVPTPNEDPPPAFYIYHQVPFVS